jgi:nucleoside phosphorylase/5'-deoxynucleotidase YfbR-like HD superfamily hydrolase
MSSVSNGSTLPVDCGVVIALKEEFEDKFIFEGFTRTFATDREPVVVGARHFYRFQFQSDTGNDRAGIVTVLFAMGNAASQEATSKMIDAFDPTFLVNIGISGSLDKDAQLGDIVVATLSDDYEYAGAVDDSPNAQFDLKWGGAPQNSFHPFVNIIRQLPLSNPALYRDWQDYCRAEFSAGFTADTVRMLQEHNFVHAAPCLVDGPVAAGNKVVRSDTFRKALLDRNRKFIAVDMESAGFLRSCLEQQHERRRIVLRAISDFAGPRKQELDAIGGNAIRAWAMANGYNLLAKLLKHTLPFDRVVTVPLPKPESGGKSQRLEQHLTKLVFENYLKRRYVGLQIRSIGDLDASDRLFRWAITAPNYFQANETNIIQQLETAIVKSTAIFPVRIDGEPGTGKSSLLNILYLWFLHRHTHDPSYPFPLYIDLRRYLRHRQEPPVTIAARFHEHLEPFRTYLDQFPWLPVVIFIDGIDQYVRLEVSLEAELLDIIGKHQQVKKIVAVGLNYLADKERFKRDLAGFNNPETHVILSAILSDDPRLPGAIDTVQEVTSLTANTAVRQAVLASVKAFGLATVDVFTLSLLVRHLPAQRSAPVSLAEFYSLVCDDFLTRGLVRGSMSRAANLAFSYCVRPEPLKHDDHISTREWALLHRHRLISDYLIAVYVVECFRELGRGTTADLKDLTYVYPHEINRFIKDLVNVSRESQLLVLKGAERAYKVGPLTTKTHACYIAGRVIDRDARPIAEQFLDRCLLDSNVRSDDRAMEVGDLLLQRTIYISLAYLGRKDASEAYLVQLMQNEAWDELNRGFHMEYYGDIAFDPQDPMSMSHQDPMDPPDAVQSCRLTVDKLYRRIEMKVDDANYGLFWIEVYTLCTLVQHRHAVGRLPDDMRQLLIGLIPQLLDRGDIPQSLIPYLRMLSRNLGESSFPVGKIIGQLERLKCQARMGWVDAGIPQAEVENVASHILLAVYLATVYLPEMEPAWDGYNKQEVVNLLLFHDIGEYKDGDVPQAKKTELDVEKEADAIQYLAACGTYLGVADLSFLYSRWQCFETDDGQNARIARDIDRLEYLVQLYEYRERLSPDVVRTKRNEVRRRIHTEAGARILKVITEAYEISLPSASK